MKRKHSTLDVTVDRMLKSANARVKEDPEGAFETYRKIVELGEHPKAMFSLGELYEEGRGVEQDYLQAAYWFTLAEALGNMSTEQQVNRCTRKYMEQNLEDATPLDLYLRAQRYSTLLSPREDGSDIMRNYMCHLAVPHLKNGEYAQAAKFLRTAAEYYNQGDAQCQLGALYSDGNGVKQNDLAAMYWFDRAADNGVQWAKEHRDHVLHECYVAANGDTMAFLDQVGKLCTMCVRGDADVPQDYNKAQYWRARGQQMAKTRGRT